MTRNEFIQKASIAFRTNGAGAAEAWAEASKLADAAPAGMFDTATRSAPVASGGGASGGDGATFPNFGATKNEPVRGSSEKNIRYYAKAALRTLADEAQSKWHDKERQRLATYVAELERQGFDASEFKQAKDDGRRAPPVAQTTLDDDPSSIPF